MTTDAAERPAPVSGLGEGVDDLLGGLPTDTSQLVEGGLASVDVTIWGFERDPGGEKRVNPQGEEWITPEQLIIHLKVHDIDGIDFTRQFLGLPGRKPDGTMKSVAINSKLGIWLASLAGLGISGDPETAFRFQMGSYSDLIGLHYHREREKFETFRNQTTDVDVPTVLYDFDNDHRKEVGLEAATLKPEA